MRILIIGGVAAGTSAGAKARRNSEDAQIVIYEMDKDISYSGCGLPYYIADDKITREQIVPRDAKFFKDKYNIDVFTQHKVLSISRDEKKIEILNMKTKEIFFDNYDKLVIATGAKSFIPRIEGLKRDNYFTLRNVIDADKIKSYIDKQSPKDAVILGTGFIGLEMAQALLKRGIKVTLVEMLESVMPSLDEEMSFYIEEHLEKNNIKVILGKKCEELRGSFGDVEVILDDKSIINTDFVIISTGIKPNVELAVNSGIELGKTGAIKVTEKMQTNDKDIFACGDCTESYFLLDNSPMYRPLGSTANKMGRITGDTIFDKELTFRGILGTGIFEVLGLNIAQTGLSESFCKKMGIDYVMCHNIKPNKPTYMGGENLVIKAIANAKTKEIIGVQIIGTEGVDKRIDVFVTAMSFRAKTDDLFHLDLAYAPPFSTTKDPVMYTGMILENIIEKNTKLITPNDLIRESYFNKDIQIIDTRVKKQYEKAHVKGAVNIPHSKFRSGIMNLKKDCLTVTYCNKGVTGNATQNILINNGFKNVYNISGGHQEYEKLIKRLEKRDKN